MRYKELLIILIAAFYKLYVFFCVPDAFFLKLLNDSELRGGGIWRK